MAQLRIERVLALPAILTASTMYIVQAAQTARAELFFTNTAGTVARHIIDEADISNMINSALANFSSIDVVATIPARDALVLTSNTIVLVVDASADPTVATGAATYVYNLNTTTWDKISEFATIDAVINWSSIVGTPISTPAVIDAAVGQSHTHGNKVVLDSVGDDGAGNLTYGGIIVQAYISVSNW